MRRETTIWRVRTPLASIDSEWRWAATSRNTFGGFYVAKSVSAQFQPRGPLADGSKAPASGGACGQRRARRNRTSGTFEPRHRPLAIGGEASDWCARQRQTSGGSRAQCQRHGLRKIPQTPLQGAVVWNPRLSRAARGRHSGSVTRFHELMLNLRQFLRGTRRVLQR